MFDEILDSELAKKEFQPIFENIKWWERRRGIFNLILIGVEWLMVLSFWGGTLQFGIGNTMYWSVVYFKLQQ